MCETFPPISLLSAAHPIRQPHMGKRKYRVFAILSDKREIER
jgi:hypothetical protein